MRVCARARAHVGVHKSCKSEVGLDGAVPYRKINSSSKPKLLLRVQGPLPGWMTQSRGVMTAHARAHCTYVHSTGISRPPGGLTVCESTYRLLILIQCSQHPQRTHRERHKFFKMRPRGNGLGAQRKRNGGRWRRSKKSHSLTWESVEWNGKPNSVMGHPAQVWRVIKSIS